MSENQSSYRNIIKATSIFGGVQIFTILISIIRSKFIAVFLGSAGMGIVGLLSSATGLIGGITNFGLGTIAVRDVSAANSSGDETRVALVITVLRRWVWVTGALGTLIVLLLSPWLSQITFGTSNYIWSFVLISITLLFNQLNVGQLVVLQGMRKIKYLAKASLSGSVLGLLVTIPLYYCLGVDGIVPALIIASFVSFAISWYFARKVQISRVNLTKSLAFSEGKNMLKMGFMISLSSLFVTAATYIIQLFISNRGGVDQVGLFTAGFAIINTYVGLVFTAMATDYFPRLSAVAKSNELCKKTINQQAEISILILGPVIMMFLVFIKLIIIILYSTKFVAIEDMVLWLAVATFFKAAAWAIGFILLAKGATKIFFWNDLCGNLYMLMFDLAGYYFWGLTGLGISFFVGYFIYFSQVFLLSKIKYHFSFNTSFLKIFAIQFSLAISCFGVVKFVDKPYSYLLGSGFILFSVWHSYIELDKRLGIKMVLNDFLSKRLNR
ncbi:O-antigen translocase [Flavobacterium frigoris]|uniref:Membrane protein involved in the export of O-antigen and teichoic acid n=1 Tax=Flavobacterium frigoris TaxID=229204 RepID=A0A1H9Q1I2_FLAFI|nr:O-antigen translocase [Flavobacterium frigoris]SER54252.1 Membrane protein involved in the export of O-antigen and teichoic acid [Flavobacterium frigoris]